MDYATGQVLASENPDLRVEPARITNVTTTHALGGDVAPAPHREFGLATIDIEEGAPLFASVPAHLRVWASHGDFVKAAPTGLAAKPSGPTFSR